MRHGPGIAACSRLLFLWGLVSLGLASRGAVADPPPTRAVLPIYEDATDAAATPFLPSGWMPDGSGISYTDRWSENPHSGSTCIKFGYSPAAGPWVGLYFLAGGEWGDAAGVNVYEALRAKKGDRIQLSFWARSDDGARAEFKVGGVNRGRNPDSVPFALTTRYQTLPKEWKRFTIDLSDSDVHRLQGGFCIVTSAAENRGRDQVWFYVDDVRIEGPRVPPPARSELGGRLGEVRWAAYSPTGFDPTKTPKLVPTEASLRADLEALRPYADGLITYGAKDGLERVPAVARGLGYRGVIQGIWDPKDSIEVEHVVQLAEYGLIDAVCCGNEGLDQRYSWDELRPVIEDLRKRAAVPVTTTEQIEDYGIPHLIEGVDFVLPNIHPVWHSFTDAAKAVEWFELQVTALKKKCGTRFLLVKETGFPSGPAPFGEEAQVAFWRAALAAGLRQKTPVALFEAFDAPWKHEAVPTLGDVGPFWGLLTADRRPKAAAASFLVPAGPR